MAKVQKIKGFVDLFPDEAAKYTFMERNAREVFSRYGFGELRTPILEKTELFQKSIGEDTDVVGKEMFTFPDRKGRSLTMRPEATAGMLRAFIDSKTHQPGKISKFFCFGPMFRYERPQMGRQRQFNQLDVEIFGAPEAQADAELILMLKAFLNAIGLTKLTIELNSLGCHECRPAYKQALVDYYKSKDKSKFCEDCQRRMETNPLRVLDCKVPACKELVQDAPVITDHLCDECETHFADVRTILDGAGVAYVLNPRMVRGLDYYVRTCFEVASFDIGSQTAVAGGGRYDGLIKNLGGPDCPGTGFACGMERLALLMDNMETPAPDFYLAVVDDSAANEAMLFAQQLRDKGLTGEVSFSGGSMKSRMRAANKSGAKTCLILGGDELANKTITVKDMADGGEQETLDRALYLASL